MSLFFGGIDKFDALLHEELIFFLTDGTTQNIGFTKRNSCESAPDTQQFRMWA